MSNNQAVVAGGKRNQQDEKTNVTTNNNNNRKENGKQHTDDHRSDDNASSEKHYIVKKGDFSSDRTICHMMTEKKNNDRVFSVIVEQSVVCGIIDHTYSDHNNEVIGLLGGFFDEKSYVVYISCFKALKRDIGNIAIDGVECDPNELIKAQEFFQEKDLIFCGWYHSHPRIPPFPSMKDLQMQFEMQTQAQYAVGLICSAYYNEGTTMKKSEKHSFYMNCFRVEEKKGKYEALKVSYTVNNTGVLQYETQNEMVKTLNTGLAESKDTFTRLFEQAVKENNKSKQLYIMSKYQSFLFDFWNNSINTRSRVLRQDIENLRAQNTFLKKKLDDLNRKKDVLEPREPKEKKTKHYGNAKLIHGNKSVSLSSVHVVNSPSFNHIDFIENERETLRLIDEEEEISEESVIEQPPPPPSIEFLENPRIRHHNNAAYHCYNKAIVNGMTYKIGDHIRAETISNGNVTVQPARIQDIICLDIKNPDRFSVTFFHVLYYYGIGVVRTCIPKDVADKHFSDSGEEEIVLYTNPFQLFLQPNKVYEKIFIYDYEACINLKYGGRALSPNQQLYYCRYQLRHVENAFVVEDIDPTTLDKLAH
ncbi:predicted protein [Naegleria gruberi]|uniref:Predicted protein n=1 Tax=Naegleria gruberi TaxID=5762 RepID=D2VIK1_NAEGR|nr:uncharacterized protein NAEGRDRAFT_68707 [Naegleria gruberi]EFC43283.1 predicted protein [Naegleria gruberi]|eukprot:XP_002676027.1 predicted protein [Naegleria gruberi strain NEG-M]